MGSVLRYWATSGVVSTSSFKAKSDMVVILLAKAEKGVKWSHLKKSDKDAADKPK